MGLISNTENPCNSPHPHSPHHLTRLIHLTHPIWEKVVYEKIKRLRRKKTEEEEEQKWAEEEEEQKQEEENEEKEVKEEEEEEVREEDAGLIEKEEMEERNVSGEGID